MAVTNRVQELRWAMNNPSAEKRVLPTPTLNEIVNMIPKWPWRSRSINTIFNWVLEGLKIHIWCKFGDPSSKRDKLSQGQARFLLILIILTPNDLEGQGQSKPMYSDLDCFTIKKSGSVARSLLIMFLLLVFGDHLIKSIALTWMCSCQFFLLYAPFNM